VKDVIIVGGGIAGLLNAIRLSREGLDILVIEKNRYPFHKVCGEYISNEVKPYLKSLSLFPDELGPARISKFQLSSTKGTSAQMDLDLGGFGVSRYSFDRYLYEKAVEAGAAVELGSSVESIFYHSEEDHFRVKYGPSQVNGKIVIGAYGKRSKIDRELGRDFIQNRSPFIGVKYHVKTDFPPDLIALHNFRGGYCGVSMVENQTHNICYLSSRENLKKWKDIETMEKQVLYRNPLIKDLFENSDFLFPKPEVINEISFSPKTLVDQHLLMCGDTAGMITPLCGNGMAMAIHSAKILSELILKYGTGKSLDRARLETEYSRQWRSRFAFRLLVGRKTQNLFGGSISSGLGVGLVKNLRPIATWLMSRTHGKPV